MISLILVIISSANFKQVVYFPHGTWGSVLLAFDADHDGRNELFVYSVGDTGTLVYKHTEANQYTASRLFGLATIAIGYGDTDSLTDAYVHVWTPPSYIDPIGIYESRDYNSYPDTLICYLIDSTPWGTLGYFVDFDQDGQMNLITTYSDINVVRHFCLFENTGDNSYAKTCEYDFPNSGPGDMAIDDFDGDGLLEIVCGDIDGKVYVFENIAIGVDSFQLVWTYQLPSGFGNAYITAKGNDMDADGKLEFIVGADAYDRWCFTMFETNGNNSYQKVWQYFYYYGGSLTLGDIDCGDVDGDGKDEMVTFGGLVLNVWDCVGPDSFVSIWDRWYAGDLTNGVLLVYDLNQNGVAEVIVSGGSTVANPPAKTYIYEKQPSVTWIYPAQYDTLWANDTVNLIWRLDETVSLESLRIYIAHPLMGCWLVYQGLPTDTTCTFVVPDTESFMAFKFWVAVNGYLRYDSIVSPPFYIKRESGIIEQIPLALMLKLAVSPNPFNNKVNIRYTIQDTGNKIKDESQKRKAENSSISLKIYDVTGRLIKSFNPESYIMNQASDLFWRGDDDLGYEVPEGVYFVHLKGGDISAIKKIIKLRR